ncbi:MAG: guanylate kinase, partial [Armatimonadetes bacterium]|nr:guanylate kinase [Anaerolineae bacterium]
GGVGKNALMHRVMPRFDRLHQLPTATTRAPRSGEQHGRERLFVSLDTFMQMVATNALVEHEEVHPGKWYGVPRALVEEALCAGEDLIADIEIAGAEKVYAAYPANTVLIFIAPPSLKALEARMEQRGETEAGIAERLARAERELNFKDRCQYVIINDVFETAAAQLCAAIAAERTARDHTVAQPALREG